MKVAIVSQYYKPEAVPIPSELAAGLAARGHRVHVVTGFPNYPAGKLFPGYRQRLWHIERDGDATVHRVPIFVSHSTNPLGRILNYLSFGISALVAGSQVRGADVVYVYATPMTAAFAPWVWRWTHRLPFVLHVQDVWPESITGSNLVHRKTLNSLISALLTPWLRWLYGAAGATIAIAPTMSKTLAERGLRADKSFTVFNWGNEPAEVGTRRVKASGACTLMYAGNIGELQDLETVIRAAVLVRDMAGFRLILRGVGTALPRLRALARERNATNVEFRERVEADRLAELYAEADFQLVPLRDLPIFKGTIPSKFPASLAFGVPVITTVRGDVDDLVRKHHLGFVAEPQSAASLAEAFRAAARLPAEEYAAMSRRAYEFYSRTMSRELGITVIEGILDRTRRAKHQKGTA